MDAARVESAVTPRTKAIVPVHLYGSPVDIEAICSIAERRGLWVIEDCAQSHGASYHGRKTGAWGAIGVFSFYPTKNLGAVGDAGISVTNDDRLVDRMRLLREYGWRERYVSEISGLNSRMDEIQAAVLRVKLGHLDEMNARRRSLARTYDAVLAQAKLGLPRSLPGAEPVYHQYVVRSPRREELRGALSAAGIGTLIHYPVPVHLQPAYRDRVGTGIGSLPNSERVAREVLSLPMHPYLSSDQVGTVARAIMAWQQAAGAG
jgi:dTDP-4-amino-4,6-dideoxygalactose transaminase